MPDKRIFFHVGAPKTGTTYLQNVLFQNRELLAANGVLYPYEDPGESFRSMQDFRGLGWAGGAAKDFAGEWEKVAARARNWDGPAVIVSNELLGGSSPERIARGLKAVEPAEVSVIFTARDFARQLVSDWQEHIKHKHTVTLEQFVEDLIELGLDAPKPFGEMFWGMHDPSLVLGRWEQFVPPDRITVVTVPQRGAPRGTLWQRFCSVTGLEPDVYDAETDRANPSMGVAETELVRRMNEEVRGMPTEVYDPLVRRVLAEDILGGQSPRLRLPPEHLPWTIARSRQLIQELNSAGYRVEGDLEELVPRPVDHEGYVSPTNLTDADLAPAALRAATGLLKHSGRQRRRIQELQGQLSGRPRLAAPAPHSDLRKLLLRARSLAGRLARRLQAS